jgi:hypothetical protein
MVIRPGTRSRPTVRTTRPSQQAQASFSHGTHIQTASPIFQLDGYHQASSSPTIDAGISDPLNGSSDIDGQTRAFGAAPDIGADEYVPAPAARSTAATGMTVRHRDAQRNDRSCRRADQLPLRVRNLDRLRF